MTAPVPADIQPEERKSRFSVTPALELLVLATAALIAAASYVVITSQTSPQRLIAPALVAFLLVANLVPGVALLMLLGRRIARRRAARSEIGGGGQLHVRLVALFSSLAAVPMLLVTIFASLLFQYGVQFWYSDRARGAFENATTLTRASYDAFIERWEDATVTMAADVANELSLQPIDSPGFPAYLFKQVYYRSLSEAAIFAVSPRTGIQTLAVLNPYEINLERQVTPEIVNSLRGGRRSVVVVTGDRIQTFTRLPGSADTFLYAARVSDPKVMTTQTRRAEAALANYRALLTRARSLQLQFNLALLVISLLIVGVAVWIALAVADRLVRPVAELVGAARRVEGGDLSARVTDPRSRDEVGTLAQAFNRMTGQLQQQNTALVTANEQLDSRRALIEAVMSGVSAGVIAADNGGVVRLANRSATALLGAGDGGSLVGRPLGEVAPSLGDLIASGAREAIVEVTGAREPRTLAVRLAQAEAGPILTFDDITQQQLDQRRAAWADVARRIAHEIKNPLTPIQLAAERLQRRYGKTVDAEDTTFARLTDTIIRQVGDLRRMVDEFSSFARMPKPAFRREGVVDIVRQAVFLHEVAHPGITFSLVHDEPGPVLVCDRRQIGQALTNIVKNAVEAIEGRGERGAVAVSIGEDGDDLTIAVADDGVGLPAERDRIVEPYMTTRARGTGLGLAIVKKIVEEHMGTITFADRPGGGTIVTMAFSRTAPPPAEDAFPVAPATADDHLATLTRNRI